MLDYRLAIFDLDGTLIDSMHAWEESFLILLEKNGYAINEALINHIHRMCQIHSYSMLHCDEVDLPMSDEEIEDSMYEILEDFYKNKAKTKTGAREALAYLKDNSVEMIVLSSTRKGHIEAALESNEISSFFSKVISSTDLNMKKSDEKLYEAIVSYMGYEKRETIVFEDNCDSIAAAKRAGIRVCALYDETSKEKWEDIKMLANESYETFNDFLKNMK